MGLEKDNIISNSWVILWYPFLGGGGGWWWEGRGFTIPTSRQFALSGYQIIIFDDSITLDNINITYGRTFVMLGSINII